MELDPIAREAALAVGAASAEILLGTRVGDRVAGAWPAQRNRSRVEGPGLSTPLRLGGDVVGSLEVRRDGSPRWVADELAALSGCAVRAADAARTATIGERRQRQGAGIERSLASVRKQLHEHANRLHALDALTAMGEKDEAGRFLAELLETGDAIRYAALQGIEDLTLGGILTAEIQVAAELGIALDVDPRSRLSRLPEAPAEAGWVALAGSLFEFAFEGAGIAAYRRRVTFGAWETGGGVVLRVRDPEPESSPHSLRAAFLRQAVAAVGGSLTIEPHPVGTQVTVRVPEPRPRLAVDSESSGTTVESKRARASALAVNP